ncbi:MAG: phosphatidate cytidylyltransferase [Pseudomonadota bacterium]
MLLSRVLTAFILLPLAIMGILYLPGNYFSFLLGLIFLIGAFEWTKISIIEPIYGLLFVVCSIFFMWLLWQYGLSKSAQFIYIIYFSVFFWLISVFFISQYPRYKNIWATKLAIKFLVGFIVLIPSWYAMVLLKNTASIQILNSQITGSELLLLMMIVIWFADTGAYFSGKKWGKSKLIPNVSPGKTKQGAYGAVVTSCSFTGIFSYILSHDYMLTFYTVLLTVFIVATSIVGDLFESMYKRNSGIKDSGKILPGHGGVLDRIDSLTSVAPVFIIIILFVADNTQELFL